LDVPKERVEELKKYGEEYRILSYPYYAEDKLILGMEEKDMKDVCAVFLDHEVGEGAEKISPQRMRKALKKDKKLALTVMLNLRNIIESMDTLKDWMTKSEVSTVTDRVETLLKDLPRVDKKWDKPWWNTAVETPVVQ
jgi:hypothetical protein